MTLGERKLRILAAIVEAYIRTGEPVGSKMICERLGNTVSSATIRNEMADLAERGLLEQPHTSAGRVPTGAGYRMYIGSRMEKAALSAKDQQTIDAMLMESGGDPEHLLETAVRSLAFLTNYATVSTSPRAASTTVHSVQVVPVGRRTAVVVLMTSVGILKNRVCRCGFDLTPEVMRVVTRLVNEKIIGRPLNEVTVAYIQSLAASIGEFVFLIAPILLAILEAVQDAVRTNVIVGGQGNLLDHSTYSDARARQVLDFLNHREDVAALLNDGRSGLRIGIGAEMNRPELVDCSVVSIGYRINGTLCGRLALIGPTRMNYPRVIAIMEYFSERVSQLLTDMLRNE